MWGVYGWVQTSGDALCAGRHHDQSVCRQLTKMEYSDLNGMVLFLFVARGGGGIEPEGYPPPCSKKNKKKTTKQVALCVALLIAGRRVRPTPQRGPAVDWSKR